MDLTNLKTNVKVFVLEGWTSYVMIGVGLFLLLAVVGLTSTFVIQNRAHRMTAAHQLPQRTHQSCGTIDGPAKLEFINGQREETRNLGNQHRGNAINYFSYFYTTWLTITIFGLIAAISLAVITKSGISGSSPHLISVFLISTAIVVLYQGSFDTLKQKANIDLNATASIKYAILLDQIDTYCVTGKVSMRDPNDVLLAALPKAEGNKDGNADANAQTETSEDPPSPKILPFFVQPDGDQFINFVAWQMDRLRNFSITVDDTKIGSIDTKRFMF
jgi:hypothetical protein